MKKSPVCLVLAIVLLNILSSCGGINHSQDINQNHKKVKDTNNSETIVLYRINTYSLPINNYKLELPGYKEPYQGGQPLGINSILLNSDTTAIMLDNLHNNLKTINIQTGRIVSLSSQMPRMITDIWRWNNSYYVPTDNYEYIYVLDNNLKLIDSLNCGDKGNKEIFSMGLDTLTLSYVGNIKKSSEDGFTHEVELICITKDNNVAFRNTILTSDDINRKRLGADMVVQSGRKVELRDTTFIFPDDSAKVFSDYSGNKSMDIAYRKAITYRKSDKVYEFRVYSFPK